MNNYTISMSGESSARLRNDLTIDGYVFNSLYSEDNNTFLVKKNIKADTWREAITDFNKNLESVADALAFHRQSAVSSYGVSTIITKEGSDRALALLLQKTPGVGLSITGNAQLKEQAEIVKLSQAKDEALGHFRSSMLATGANAVTFSLLQCAESLAGATPQSVKCSKCKKNLVCKNCEEKYRPVMTDHNKLKVILGELYSFYYQKQPNNTKSYRNLLAHGYYVDEYIISQKVDDLYDALKTAIKTKYDITNMSNIIGVRPLYQHKGTNLFIKYTTDLPTPDKVFKMIESQEIHESSSPYSIVFGTSSATLDSF